jgi:hypothetical protein
MLDKQPDDPWRDAGYNLPEGPRRKIDPLAVTLGLLSFLGVCGAFLAIIFFAGRG